jgi:hypothetical protein
MGKRVVVGTHGHCFDGLASAALFVRLHRHVAGEGTSYAFHALGYAPGQRGVDPAILDGDENAVLDYRFTPSEKLTWYFDHHVTAFAGEGEREAFRRGAAGGRMFHDGAYGSCAKLIADVSRERFGLDPGPVANLVAWADKIDAARFASAEEATNRSEPVMRLRAVAQIYGDDELLKRFVPRLLDEPLEAVATSEFVERAFAPIAAKEDAFRDAARRVGRIDDGVVVVDLADGEWEVAPTFITYALFPHARYSVLLTRSRAQCKLSIGYNPWCGEARTHDIAAICARYGGGGHPVVGGVARRADEVDEARRIAAEIAEELAA